MIQVRPELLEALNSSKSLYKDKPWNETKWNRIKAELITMWQLVNQVRQLRVVGT